MAPVREEPVEQQAPHNHTGMSLSTPQVMTLPQTTGTTAEIPGPSMDSVDHQDVSLQHRQALQRLVRALLSPESPEQQDEILEILRSSPRLMAAFIKQRQQDEQRLQQAEQQQQPQPQQQQPQEMVPGEQEHGQELVEGPED